jgi:Zn-dependent protease with chaperone function
MRHLWLLRGLFACVGLGVGGVSSAFAVQSYEPVARLSMSWESSTGPTWIWLFLEEGELDVAAIQEGFRDSFGCEPTEEEVHDPYDPVEITLWAECPGLTVREGLSLRVDLDLTELGNVLEENGVRYLSVTLSHSSSAFTHIEAPVDFEETKGWGYGHYVYYTIDLQEDDVQPVILEMGYDVRQVSVGAGLLAVVFVLPIVLTLRRRFHVLGREPTGSDETSWFAHWRFFHWLSLGTFFGWIVFFLAFSFWGVLGFLLSEWVSWSSRGIRLGLMFLPPFLSILLCQLISAPVLDHIRGKKGIGRRMIRASQLGTAMMVLPLVFVVIGVLTLFRDPRLGLLWVIGAFLVRLVLAGLLTRDEDFVPHAVTVGELRDRVFELAERLGVKVRQLYVFPAEEIRMANAFAVQGGNVILTDFLLRNLSKKEVDGVVAHELAHIRHHHPLLLSMSMVVPILVVMMGFYGLGAFLQPLGLNAVSQQWGWILGATAGLMVFFFVARRFELTADADAVLLTGEHEAMISGLAKLTKANLLPQEWGGGLRWFLTHPSLTERANAVASRVRLSPERIRALIEGEADDPSRYATQSSASEKRIFSTMFKAKTVTRIGLTMIGLMALSSGIVVSGVHYSGLEGAFRNAAYALGWVICLCAVVFASDRLSTWGYRRLRGGLRLRLEQDGIDVEGGVFVNFAPEREPRLYEHYSCWDVGFVFLEKDRLIYLGDQVRFSIRRESVVDVQLEKGFPSWSRPLRTVIRYKDDKEKAERFLAFTVAETGSVRASRPLTRDLKQRVEAWRSGGAGEDVPPSLPRDLRPPELREVTSEPPRSTISTDRVLQTMILVSAAAVLVSMLFGLGFSFTNGEGWLVLLLSILSAIFQLLPIRGSGVKS